MQVLVLLLQLILVVKGAGACGEACSKYEGAILKEMPVQSRTVTYAELLFELRKKCETDDFPPPVSCLLSGIPGAITLIDYESKSVNCGLTWTCSTRVICVHPSGEEEARKAYGDM